MTPMTLREAATLIFLWLRAVAEGLLDGRGVSKASGQLRDPDPLEMVDVVTALRDAGCRDGAEQLLNAISLIVVSGGWQAVLDDPEANKAWARGMRRLG